MYFGAEQPSMKCRYAPSSTMMSVCSNWPAPWGVQAEIGLQRDGQAIRPVGTYTKEPPDHTAPCRAANLWSVGLTSFMKWVLHHVGIFAVQGALHVRVDHALLGHLLARTL